VLFRVKILNSSNLKVLISLLLSILIVSSLETKYSEINIQMIVTIVINK